MIYELILQPEAEQHLKEWQKSGQNKILKKIANLFAELREHPKTGTGQVEQLKGNLSGFWSRRIDKGSRMIYTIEDEIVVVTVVSLKGHYGDK
ncbi:MAG: Txe/YoeB family addiction module toxin [Candidatus Amulumruptor caecigallinarius]|uniref:Putative mRNA interferase YoeB n=1 Tax=Candidatus Amulumruptor caecigallinarius TaxID=2109911 RepID=A0A4Q0UAA4_9BACT|nr:MAG: Txe/YoeB family addiction module toxin [Candidatus Amulumruptor caecigallinarius]HJE38711.1 Txe/YoeB family addiction module toxin [Candidatus Amulumruptor caecigallinarius]